MSIRRLLALGAVVGFTAAAAMSASVAANSHDGGNMRNGTSDAVSNEGALSLKSGQRGVIVRDVQGKAKELGLRQGDVITTLDARSVRTPEDIMSVMRSSQAERHTLGIARKGGRPEPLQVATAAWRRFITPPPPEPPMAGNEPPTPPATH